MRACGLRQPPAGPGAVERAVHNLLESNRFRCYYGEHFGTTATSLLAKNPDLFHHCFMCLVSSACACARADGCCDDGWGLGRHLSRHAHAAYYLPINCQHMYAISI